MLVNIMKYVLCLCTSQIDAVTQSCRQAIDLASTLILRLSQQSKSSDRSKSTYTRVATLGVVVAASLFSYYYLKPFFSKRNFSFSFGLKKALKSNSE